MCFLNITLQDVLVFNINKIEPSRVEKEMICSLATTNIVRSLHNVIWTLNSINIMFSITVNSRNKDIIVLIKLKIIQNK